MSALHLSQAARARRIPIVPLTECLDRYLTNLGHPCLQLASPFRYRSSGAAATMYMCPGPDPRFPILLSFARALTRDVESHAACWPARKCCLQMIWSDDPTSGDYLADACCSTPYVLSNMCPCCAFPSNNVGCSLMFADWIGGTGTG